MNIGIFFLVYYFCAPSTVGRALYKAQSKKNLIQQTYYTFTDDEIRVSTSDSSSVYNYSAIEELYETDEIYCLYFNKTSAFVIPKKCIENPLCDVKMFLQSKVGKDFIFVKRKSDGKTAAKVLGVSAAFVAVTFLAALAGDLSLYKPKTFTYEDYSITLDKHFYEWDNSDCDYGLTTSDLSFALTKFTQEDVDYFVRKDNTDLEEFTRSYAEDSEVKEFKKLTPSTCYIAFYDEYEGYEYYNTVCIKQVDGEYWVSHFFTDRSMEEDYALDMKNWISSIEIKKGETI